MIKDNIRCMIVIPRITFARFQPNRELSGRVLDLRPNGHGLEPHRRHCIVSFSKTH